MAEAATPAPPALPPASLSILALLVPFHPPLAPNILSTPLNTRHTFIPPTESEPDSYLSSAAVSTSTDSDGKLGAWAQRNPISARLEELSTSSARDDLHFGTIAYWRPDEATFVARARILGFEDARDANERPVEVEWLWEGERDMGGRGWTLHSVDLTAALSGSEWQEDREIAWNASSKPSAVESVERDGDEEGETAGNDFWSSYSASPEQAAAPIPQDTPTGDEDNNYWAAYGSVDDGLAGTQPATPELRNNMSFTHLKEHNWGTGGETPVSWSPQQSEHASLAPLSVRESPKPTDSLLLSRTEPEPDQDQDQEITPPAAVVDLASPASSVVLDAKHAHLVKLLSGTWELWRASAGEDESASRKSFKDAVDEVLGK